MLKRLFVILGCGACGLALLIAAGCEEKGTPAPSPADVDVSGTWGLQQDTDTDVHTMVLGQSGNTITGSVNAFVGQTTPIVGLLSGMEITLVMNVGVSNVVDFSGVASHNSMSGTWRNTASAEGTWTATRK